MTALQASSLPLFENEETRVATLEECWAAARMCPTHATFMARLNGPRVLLRGVWRESNRMRSVSFDTVQDVLRLIECHRLLLLYLEAQGVFMPGNVRKKIRESDRYREHRAPGLVKLTHEEKGRKGGAAPPTTP